MQQTVAFHVRATETMELEVITDVKAPPGLKLKITKERSKWKMSWEKQKQVHHNINLPAGVQAAIKYHSGSAHITTEVLPNKIIVQGYCINKFSISMQKPANV